MTNFFETLIQEYYVDKESVYHTWFINNEERLKAFRTIRNGIKVVIADIEQDQFGVDFKGSSLETVITAISEQKQLFEGAAHAFYWKPKLRIPDIYENTANKKTFGRFLKKCLQYSNEKQLIDEILKLNNEQIKGLGPAVANILYFLHPTTFPPFNTAIVKGFNLLFNQKVKLGSWLEYLRMRDDILAFNSKHSTILSKDLGAIGGLLYEIGVGRIVINENFKNVLNDIEKREKTNLKRHLEVINDKKEDHSHTEMQFYLAKVGVAVGYKVWIAKNDHNRCWNNHLLGELSLKNLELEGDISPGVRETISLIDVLWINDSNKIVCAFEVEKSTSIYSGILRLFDLSLVMDNDCRFILIAPDKREREIKAQLLRPSFQHNHMCSIAYILFSDLRCDCEAMCKYGTNASVIDKISKTVASQSRVKNYD
ncbi:hypothetical protein [Bacillus sp. PS06]|uniref:hypothetical protein n=1 Tax=Bacillus sp. PS06 TaxID=2764176 RepID=UPI0017835DF7|nr:hypothetical protein [Bacillus sp. PS06]MBD8071297.1 hypothetical protein [Bacillus sp. PS06]